VTTEVPSSAHSTRLTRRMMLDGSSSSRAAVRID
jgi:hypothetical protein